MKAITIFNCNSCPHTKNWSSGGFQCYHPEFGGSGKRTFTSQERDKHESTTHEICPLPNVKYQ